MRALSKDFQLAGGRKLRALRDIDCGFGNGKTIAIVGESGSGKTTLGRCIAGLETPTSGEILFDDRSIADLTADDPRKLWSRVQVVFQDPSGALNPAHRVGSIVAEGLRQQSLSDEVIRDKVREMCRRLAISETLLDLYPSQLTIGEQQRVGIARALIMNPEVVIFDEPTSMLDPNSRYEILRLLHEMRESRNFIFIFITHDLRAVRYLCDEVLVMYLGEVVEKSTPGKIFSMPSHPYTEALVASMVELPDGRPPLPFRLKGEIPSALDIAQGCSFRSRCDFATDVCASRRPELFDLPEGVQCRCFNYETFAEYLGEAAGAPNRRHESA